MPETEIPDGGTGEKAEDRFTKVQPEPRPLFPLLVLFRHRWCGWCCCGFSAFVRSSVDVKKNGVGDSIWHRGNRSLFNGSMEIENTGREITAWTRILDGKRKRCHNGKKIF